MRARFLYFLHGVSGCSEEMLSKLGLLDRFLMGSQLGPWVVRTVPNGCMLATGERIPPEALAGPTVEGGEGPPRWTVGLEDLAFKPTPDDLMRDVGINGYEVTLGDGHAWLCPRLWQWDPIQLKHKVAVPQRYVPRNGRISLEPEPLFVPYLEMIERMWESCVNGTELQADEVFSNAVKLLALNYRIGPQEAGLLGLLDEHLALRVISSAFDLPMVRAHAEEVSKGGIMQPEEIKPDTDTMLEAQQRG